MNNLSINLITIVLFSFFFIACSAQIEQQKLSPKRSAIYRSNDFGQSWQAIGAGLPADIQSTYLQQFGEEFILATENAGLFISKEKGEKWQQIGEGLPSKKINALWFDASSIYVGTYQTGIFYTLDYGMSWQNLNYNLPNLKVQDILRAEGQLLVGTDIGVFQLDEVKKEWNQLLDGAQILSLSYQDGKLVVGSSKGSLISNNLGQDWTWIHQEGAVHYTHLVADHIVEMYVHGDLFISPDWGQTWINVDYTPRTESYVYEVVKLNNYWVFSNNYGIHRSSDEGRTWQLIYPEEKIAFFDLLVVDNLLYTCTREWDEFRGR